MGATLDALSEAPGADASAGAAPARVRSRRGLFIGLEIAVVLVLLAVWLGSDAIRQSRNLWVLFFYSFPSQFLLAIVPHEPVEIFFAQHHSPMVVTLVSVVGVTLVELLNYSVVRFFSDMKFGQRIVEGRFTQALVRFFNKAPFLALCVAGLTPVPFYPFRFIVVWAHYPAWKYALAVVVSRGPRYYLIALAGRLIQIPGWILIAAFIIMGAPLYVSFVKSRLAQRRSRAR